jgi:hypothetical protein
VRCTSSFLAETGPAIATIDAANIKLLIYTCPSLTDPIMAPEKMDATELGENMG